MRWIAVISGGRSTALTLPAGHLLRFHVHLSPHLRHRSPVPSRAALAATQLLVLEQRNFDAFCYGVDSFFLYSTNIDSIYHYKHTYVHPTSMITSRRLSRFYLKIYEVGQQKHLTIDGNVACH
jgi:hypothetical protein